jgi:hypothetical protein
MADESPVIATAQRTALLRHGVVVLENELEGPCPRIVVSGAGHERVRMLVAQQLGAEVEVEVWALCRASCGRCGASDTWGERPAGGRFDSSCAATSMSMTSHAAVVVFATVCTAVAGESGRAWEGPWHVYLDRPLGDRTVVDGSSGANVPYVNVHDRLLREEAALGGAPQSSSSERWRPSARRRSGSTRTRPS